MTNQKKRVLLVGQNPDVFSGNGNMMGTCLEEIDSEQYDVCVFARDSRIPIGLYKDPFEPAPSYEAPMIAAEEEGDPWGRRRLLVLLNSFDIDILVFVGIDIWRYHDVFDHIKEIQKHKGFTWKALVPYDLDHVRDDWINWLNYPDQVYIYSYDGYKRVRDKVPSAKYHRPRLRFSELYQPPSQEDKEFVRKQIFPDISNETEVFCFIGNNQVRKNIYNTVRGFGEAIKKNKKDAILFMHVDDPEQVVSIERLKRDCEIPDNKIRYNLQSRKLWPHEMAVLMQAMDCHILASMQEGLSWTVVETKLTGIPSIISQNTAHLDFDYEAHKNLTPKPIIPIKPDQVELMPLISDYGPCYLQSNSCSHTAIKKAILQYLGNVNGKNGDDYKQKIQKNARVMGVNWLNDCHNFQTHILEDEYQPDIEDNSFGEVL